MTQGIPQSLARYLSPRLFAALILGQLAFGLPLAAWADSVTFEPAGINFGSLPMDVCRVHKLVATNTGNEPIANPAFSVSEDGAFRIQPILDVPEALLPGEVCIVYIRFCPPLVGAFDAEISFTGTQETVPVFGSGNMGP